jgi:hypothetical protein
MEKIEMKYKVVGCLLIAVLSVACGPSSGEAQQQESDVPANHPPMATSKPDLSLPEVPSESGMGVNAISWLAPGEWIAEPPKNQMRRAQYRIPGPAGDGELVVFYFGPGQGGDPMSNAIRWASQFVQPDGRSSSEVLQTNPSEVNGIPVLLIEVVGTYRGGASMMGGPSELLDDYMLLGAVAEGGDANWFFKLTGPRATLEVERERFAALVASMVRGS